MRPVITSDYPNIVQWYGDHFKVPTTNIPYDWFSPIGFIEEEVAAGFIAICNNKAYIEDFITNPNSDPDQRNIALNLLVFELEKAAKNNGVKYILAFTANPLILKRGFVHGYTINDHNHNYQMIQKEL